MLPAIILFAATYVLMIAFGKYRPYIALTSGVIFILTGMLISAISPAPWEKGREISCFPVLCCFYE